MLRHPLRLALCGLALVVGCASACAETDEPAHSAELDAAIIKQAQRNGVPEALVRRIVMRESRYNPRARNHSFWGLMQISYPTAKSMGFKGTPQDLLNPIVNLRYAVPYLANAFIIAGKREDTAVRLYASGYYSTAKQRGLLSLLRTAETAPVSGAPDEPILTAAAAAPQSDSVFGSLFGAAPALQPSVQTASDGTAVPAAASVALPQGKNAADAGIDMSADRSGTLHLPKKWLHDGGSTQVARGEQGVEQVAAYDRANAAKTDTARARASRKKTNFAALDQPPANAQAYAATAEGQDLRLANTVSQAAIQQATSRAPVQPGDPATSDAQTSAPAAPQDAADDKPSRKRSTAQKHHAKAASKVMAANKAAEGDQASKPALGEGADDGSAPTKRHVRHAAKANAETVQE